MVESQDRFAEAMDAFIAGNCNSYCQSGGFGNGVVIGTAPFCGGDCSGDCRSDHCMVWPANCWTGNKICCCSKWLVRRFYYRYNVALVCSFQSKKREIEGMELN